MSLTPTWKQPSHPGLIEVVGSHKPFGSCAISLISLPAGAHFTNIMNYSFADHRTYATVQASLDQNINLNSDLLYINHSCDPALEFDMSRFEVRVSRSRALTKGDLLSFFYPSTEYQMAQVFDCHCNTTQCKGRIMGAGLMALDDLQGYWLNSYIEHQLKENEKRGGHDDRPTERQRAKRTVMTGAPAI